MNRYMKITIIVVCVVLILFICGVSGYQIWHQAYSDAVINRTYGNSYNLYGTIYASYEPSFPSYCINESGEFYYIQWSGTDPSEMLPIGKIRRFTLTKTNFEDRLSNKSNWTAYIDAETILTDNRAAWLTDGPEGTFYYFLLQANGEIYLCHGSDSVICTIVLLKELGDSSVFFNQR